LPGLHGCGSDVFTGSGDGWRQTADLSARGVGDVLGGSVAASGNLVVEGDPEPAHGPARAYIFSHDASGWHQVGELVDDV